MERARTALELAESQGPNSQNVAQAVLSFALGFEGQAAAQLENSAELVRRIASAFPSHALLGQALHLLADAHLRLGHWADARRVAAETTARMTETEIWGWSLPAYGTLARAQLELGEPAPAIRATLDEYAATIDHTGMLVFGRELAELRARLEGR